MRRSKVTLLFSLTCSVDFFMLSPYRPYNKPAFLALIPPSFTSLNPFVTFFRPLQPHSSSHNWGKYENARFNSDAFGYIQKMQSRETKSSRLRMSEENFRTELRSKVLARRVSSRPMDAQFWKKHKENSPNLSYVFTGKREFWTASFQCLAKSLLRRITFYDYIIYPNL